MSEDHKRILQTQLWNIADTLRGKMDADEFRDYILGFIFYKYLSERMALTANELLEVEAEEGHEPPRYEVLDENDPDDQDLLEVLEEEAIDKLGYFLKPSELFTNLARRGNPKEETAFKDDDEAQQHETFILEDLGNILKNIEASTLGQESEEDFGGLFEDLDLSSSKLGRSAGARNKIISKVLSHLDKIDFQLQDADSDVLGDAYEYLIAQFASGAGKKAGEFYTPAEVSTVLARLVTTGKSVLQSVYDPTCGSGSLLLRVAREVDTVHFYYGQEQNRTTYNLARMNLILHGVPYHQFDIKQEDTLEEPQHPDLRAEAIVANPPFSAKWNASPIQQNDDRFSPYGKLAPKSKADWAFVQHMLFHLAENGQMAVVLPHGALFRGGAEGAIRRFVIHERNWLDAVIGLPANIFYGTGIPTCIMVFKKCRETPDDVVFIDASQQFGKERTQNYLRAEDIDRIIATYCARETIEKYSYVAPRVEIAENDYNLNIPRYVDTFEEEEPVDLRAVSAELKGLEGQLAQVDKEILGFCEELGIETPF